VGVSNENSVNSEEGGARELGPAMGLELVFNLELLVGAEDGLLPSSPSSRWRRFDDLDVAISVGIVGIAVWLAEISSEIMSHIRPAVCHLGS